MKFVFTSVILVDVLSQVSISFQGVFTHPSNNSINSARSMNDEVKINTYFNLFPFTVFLPFDCGTFQPSLVALVVNNVPPRQETSETQV